MSDLDYNIYSNKCIQLARSMVIKSRSLILKLNKQIDERSILGTTGVNYDDPYSWKWYMNISGQYHELDEPMTVTSFDTGLGIDFTIDALQTHPQTRKAYKYDSIYFNRLVNKYPNQATLIRGIVNPVNIDTAIGADDYSILMYDDTLIEPNEYDLIQSIQARVDSYIVNWLNKDYVYSDLYYPESIYGVLLNMLPEMILVSRYSNTKTIRVHSYHLWTYLDSFGEFSKYRQYLSLEQSLWLYLNIEYIKRNSGKDSVFNTLVDKLLTSNNIPISRYHAVHDYTDIVSELVPDITIRRDSINGVPNIIDTSDTISVGDLMDKVEPIAFRNGEFKSEHTDQLNTALTKSSLSNYLTKTYESEVVDLTNNQYIDLSALYINQWLFRAYIGKYNNISIVKNPVTGSDITLNPLEAFVLYIYSLYQSRGVELIEIADIAVNYVQVEPIPTFEFVRENTPICVPDQIITDMLEIALSIRTTSTSEEFNDAVNELHKVMSIHRRLVEEIHSYDARAYVDGIFHMLYKSYRINYSTAPNQTYAEYFIDRDWDLSGLDSNTYLTLSDNLVALMLGNDLGNTITKVDIHNALIDLMSQLGTYDTQYIKSVFASNITPITYHTYRLGDTRSVGGINVLSKFDYNVYPNPHSLIDLPSSIDSNTILTSTTNGMVNLDVNDTRVSISLTETNFNTVAPIDTSVGELSFTTEPDLSMVLADEQLMSGLLNRLL